MIDTPINPLWLVDNGNTKSNTRCQNMSKPKQSSWFLNLLMLIIGILTILLAVFSYLPAPTWWPFNGPATAAFTAMVSLPIGIWMFIAALGLWKEQEWAYGASLVCFTVLLFNGLVYVVTGIMGGLAFFEIWINWIEFIIVLIAAVGFLYLLFTMGRYH